MRLVYFDEVKFQEGSQPHYWLGGLIIDAADVRALEAQVDAIAKDCFSSATLCRETELHAAEIFSRKRNFKSWSDVGKRMDVLKRLATIVGRKEGIGRVYVQLDPSRMVAEGDLDVKSFVFFVERVETYLSTAGTVGLLIGDRENGKVTDLFATQLSTYRAEKTPYAFGKELKCLIDTVHFTESHLSRMLQLADAYVWFLQLLHRASTDGPGQELAEYVRSETNLLYAHRYKQWPTESSWMRS